MLLLAMSVVALIWANSPFHHAYELFFHEWTVAASLGPFYFDLTVGHFVNDALMTMFFFVVGMEIKRELVLGELSSRARAALPVMGAIGGMVVPAAIYASFHVGEPTIRGWGIPMATDIAFAVAALSVFGSRVPPGLKVFLLALAIADDIGAVAVIAIFYTAEVSLLWLGLAVLGLGLTFALNRLGVRPYGVYMIVGGVVWYCMHHSGVHATIAGVALGFLTPSRPLEPAPGESLAERGSHALERLGELLHLDEHHAANERHRHARELARVGFATLSPLDQLTNLLHPWVAFVIMPLFALANAGVRVDTGTLSDPAAIAVGGGVALGLLVGKPIGVLALSWLAVKAGIAELPRGVGWAAVFATGVLAGIGFTVALFVSALAFSDPVYTAGSKLGILSGSFVATVVGVVILSRTLPR